MSKLTNISGPVLLLGLIPWLTFGFCMEPREYNKIMDTTDHVDKSINTSDSNKDMYVINAMVYQIGIVTNKTDKDTRNMNNTGSQESVTFYHNNGSNIDLSKFAEPLLTNVTAQSLVGVAPMAGSLGNVSTNLPWTTLSHLTAVGTAPDSEKDTIITTKKWPRDIQHELHDKERSMDMIYRKINKRDLLPDSNTRVKIVKGSAVIPETAGVQSIAIPPLLTLNNNLSEIPLPVPNTSIVHYAKVNTLVTKS